MTNLGAGSDYRSYDLLQVMHGVNHPALRMAFDTTNSFPTAEDPVDAARTATGGGVISIAPCVFHS